MKIYTPILKAYFPYSSKKDKERNVLSPLDIPLKTMLRVFSISVFLMFVIGYSFLWVLKLMALSNLKDESKVKVDLARQDANLAASRQAIYYLLPAMKDKIESINDNDLKNKIQNAFKGKDITYNSFVAFLKSINVQSQHIDDLDELIVGDISSFSFKHLSDPSNYLNIFSYGDLNANEIADMLNLKLDFTKPIKDENPDKIKRDIVISVVLKFRDQLKSNVTKPLRLLIALDGTIQWITFLAFIFCFLLLMLRFYWAKMQLQLIIQPTSNDERAEEIEWLPGFKNNLFKINGEQFTLNKLRLNYLNVFIAQRYLDEVKDSLQEDVIQDKSIYDTIQQKINSLKQDVEDAEYLIINFLLWLIPSLGFIGTIIGIIGAMQNASGIFEAITALDQIIALQNVAANLGTAFDTTFVALVLISILMLYNAIVQKTEDLIFARLNRVSFDYLIYELKYFGKKINEKL